MKTLTFNISDEAYDLLVKIKKEGYAEYRDSNFETLDDFINSDLYTVQNKSVDWFMSRNFNGTFRHVQELVKFGLVKFDDMSWHDTYVLTILGNKVTELCLNF
jgi:hypothetical protein